MLKKFLCVPLILLLLCGCDGSKSVVPILNNISFTAKIAYNEENFICNADIKDNVLILKITQPNLIKGLTLSIDKNGLNAEFDSIECDLDRLPIDNAVTVLYKIIADINGKEIVNSDSNNCRYEGITENIKYIFIFSPTGLPIELTVSSINLNIVFSNVVII